MRAKAKSQEEVEAAREAVALMLRELIDELGEQDVLVTMDEACCGAKGGTSKTKTEIIANELGANKSKLLQDLVGRYTSLYDTGGKAETFRREVDVDQADYLFAYRIYDYGTWNFKDQRVTYIKLHYRIVAIDTGRVLLSDFLEHRIDDELTSQERRTLTITYAKQSDYKRPAQRTPKAGRR